LEPVFAQAQRDALAVGRRRRFVAFLEKDAAAPLGYRAGIRIVEVPETHPAFYLRGTENAILIRSAFHPTPIVIQGPGEGVSMIICVTLASLCQLTLFNNCITKIKFRQQITKN
ncbi:MAG: hypothetical protein IIU42_01540, partial [Ruminococcus sp.]|nr:hypothetical protein [Ruminococcus sp.]